MMSNLFILFAMVRQYVTRKTEIFFLDIPVWFLADAHNCCDNDDEGKWYQDSNQNNACLIC